MKANALKKGSQKKKTPKKNGTCFVIMPFTGWINGYYDAVYCPAIEAAGLTPHRADDLYRPSTIVNDIWTYTKDATLLLADLTGKNPNVLYELGLAHAIAKPVVIVTESLDDIPFDLRSLRILEYNKNKHDWGYDLGERITRAIKEVQKDPQKSIPPAFLDVTNKVDKPSITSHGKELLELRNEMELIRQEMRRRDEMRPLLDWRAMEPTWSADLRKRGFINEPMSPVMAQVCASLDRLKRVNEINKDDDSSVDHLPMLYK